MKILLSLFLLLPTVYGANYRSLEGGGGKYASVTVPNSSPWNTRTVIRFEFRLHTWSSTGRIFQWDGLLCSKNTNDVSCTDFYDTGSPAVVASVPAGSSDIIVRVQRTATEWFIELWNADGGTYVEGQTAVADVANFSLGGDLLSILHDGGGTSQLTARLAWFRVYSTASTKQSAMPSNAAGGDLLDYEFEGNGTDASAQVQNLTVSGSPTYPSTPVVPVIGESVTVSSGRDFTPDCGRTAADSYVWTQQGAPPLGVTFSSITSASPTVSIAAVPGQYKLVCTATVNGVSATSILTVGVVATNTAGVVIVNDPKMQSILGPMLRNNVTEWAWYDRTRTNYGQYWYTATANYTNDFTGVETANYYDSCLAQYQNYYRTGFTVFLNAAQACADKWYSQYWSARAAAGTCGGSNWIAPRDASFLGIAIRAYETGAAGGGTMWTCLTDYANYEMDLWVEQRGIDNGYDSLYYGPREGAYVMSYALAVGILHPTGATQAAYLARVQTEMTNYVRGLQCYPGTSLVPCSHTYTAGAGTITATNGVATIAGSGSNFTSILANGYQLAFQDSALTNWFPTVSTVSSDTLLTLTGNYTGVTTGGMVWARAQTNGTIRGDWRQTDLATGLVGYGDFVWHTGLLTETVMRIYLSGAETTLSPLVIADFADYLVNNQARVYPTQTCTGSTGNKSARRVVYSNWFALGDTGTGCSNDTDILDQRQQNSLVMGSLGFAYFLDPSKTEVKTLGDEMFSSAYGYYTGTGADGGKGRFDDIPAGGKLYGQGARSLNYLATRLGADAVITSQSASITVGYYLASIPTAADVLVTVQMPTGTAVSQVCSSSPCTVTGLNLRPGSKGLMQLKYRNAGTTVLATGDWQPVIWN